MKNTIQTLSDQLIAAAAAGNSEEMMKLSRELVSAAQPPTFSETWNYENKPAETKRGSFANYWNFEKKG